MNSAVRVRPVHLASSYVLKEVEGGGHVVLSNRIVKASTEELLSDRRGSITEELNTLYEVWGRSGAGMILTGNMFISEAAKTRHFGPVVHGDQQSLEALKKLASLIQAEGALGVVQLNHAGRQAFSHTKQQPIAPSPIPIKGYGSLFRTPRAATEDDLREIVDDFVRSAKILESAGFAGVEIHAAHGYLLSQFLSPLINKREDRWGGSLENRARLLLRVVEEVQAAVGPRFVVGVKINSADFQRGGFAEDDSLQVIQWLSERGVDFIEISGGNYESPAMTGKASTMAREAYFLDFAQRVRDVTQANLMVTGGFRSSSYMDDCIKENQCDLIGIARPMIVEPDLPARLLEDRATKAAPHQNKLGIKKLDDMMQMFWYNRQLRVLGKTGRSMGPKAPRWSTFLIETVRLLRT